MSTTIHINRFRRRRSELLHRSPVRKAGHGCGFAVAMLITFGFVLISAAYASLVDGLPSIEEFPELVEPPDGMLLLPTRIFDRSGVHVIAELRNPLVAERVYLPLVGHPGEELIPETVISATIAASDPHFWKHPGFTLASLFRESDRTLAERLVAEILLPGRSESWRLELQESLLAFQLTSMFGREKVLEWFLNHADYGHSAYGIQAAARLYLNKPVSDLSVAEAALLAGIPGSTLANPIDDPLAAMEKQKRVILKMLENRLIDPETGIQAIREQVSWIGPLSGLERLALDQPQSDIAPAFTHLAISQLDGLLTKDQLERGGLRVITTLDYNLLQEIQCVLDFQQARLVNDSAPIGVDNNTCPALARLPSLESMQTPGGSQLQIELEVLDARSSQILFLAHAPDSRVESAPPIAHPAGSLPTPLIYLSAFAQGFSPASLSWDIPAEGQAVGFPDLADMYHGPVNLRQALANDYLAPAATLAKQAGEADILRISRQIGLLPAKFNASTEDSILEVFGEVNLLQATQMFGVFANQGMRLGHNFSVNQGFQPGEELKGDLSSTAILRVENALGDILVDWSEPISRPILAPQLAYLITDILSDEAARWTSLGNPNNLEIDRPAAVKIGRTAGDQGSWVIGYTPQLVIGVWAGSVGYDPIELSSPQPGSRFEQAAVGLWSAVAKIAHQDQPVENWPVPQGIVFTEVCVPSGMLPDPECPSIDKEVFLEGNEPLQADTLFQSFQVNQSTGLLASLFTPTDLLEKRVFMVVPPIAREWAAAAGISSPPQAYDAIPDLQQHDENVKIDSPILFEPVHGKINIMGTAAAADFLNYRLQVGQGLNPSTWLQIGNESNSQVVNGHLGLWDTAGLDGLYALQLLVLHADKSVRRSVVLVTVDNQSPSVGVISPSNGVRLSSKVKSELLLQIQSADNLELESVSIYLDGKLLAEFQSPPYAILWKMETGEHSLRAVAIDKAGNLAERSVYFSVE